MSILPIISVRFEIDTDLIGANLLYMVVVTEWYEIDMGLVHGFG